MCLFSSLEHSKLCAPAQPVWAAAQDCLPPSCACEHRVVFTPGNHDLWLRPDLPDQHPDSVVKLVDLLQRCDELGVDTVPVLVRPDAWGFASYRV